MAFGSLREVGYLIDLAVRLGHLRLTTAMPLKEKHEETARVLAGLLKALRQKREA